MNEEEHQVRNPLYKKWWFIIVIIIIVLCLAAGIIAMSSASQEKKNIDAFVSAVTDYQTTPSIQMPDAQAILSIELPKVMQKMTDAASASTPSQRVSAATEGKNFNDVLLNSLPDPTIILTDPSVKIEALNSTAGAIGDQNLRTTALQLAQMARTQYTPYEKALSDTRQLLTFENELFVTVISSNGTQNINTPANGAQFATLIGNINNNSVLNALAYNAQPELGGAESNEMMDLYSRFKGAAGIK